MSDADIYDYLATTQISGLTITQIDAATKSTFANKSSRKFWKGPVTLADIIEKSRTYASGNLPIPETGAITSIALDPGADGILQPSGTELYTIKAIYAIAAVGAATCNISLFDGSSPVPIRIGVSVATTGTIIDLNEAVSWPLLLSNPLYLQVSETGSSNAVTFFIAYYKVSL